MKQISLFKQLFMILLLCSGFSTIQSQESILAAGGNISGSGGSANYSVGQTIQNTNTGANGSAIQGIQFYFESSTLTIIDLDTNFNIVTYPNPTSSILNIKIEGSQNKSLSYKLFTSLGVLITSGNITNNVAKIDMNHLPIATYLLKVSSDNKNIKNFKIIKN